MPTKFQMPAKTPGMDGSTGKRTIMPLAVLILAAGLSRRMGNNFKPLMPFGNGTVIEHLIHTYQEAGIDNIRVVSGFKAEEIKPPAAANRICIIENPLYRMGMLSSIKAGIRSLEEDIIGFFIHPVDIPLVRAATIKKMVSVFRGCTCEVLHPVFMGKRGHPPLIDSDLKFKILAWEGEGGLRGALSDIQPTAKEISVCDEGILKDMDNPAEYRKMTGRLRKWDIPTLNECLMALQTLFPVSNAVQKHCIAVAKTSILFADEVEKKGLRLDKRLILASALLHDIVRGEKNHAAVGADLLREMGYDSVADIVAAHMDYDGDDMGTIDEKALVFLADKLVQEDRPTDFVERFKKKSDMYIDFPEATKAIRKRFDQAEKIKKSLEKIIRMKVEDLLKQNEKMYKEEFSDELFDETW